MDVARALSTFLGKDVSRHQIYSLRKTKAVEVRKARNQIHTDNRPEALDQILWDIINFDIYKFRKLYPSHIQSKLEELKAEGEPTYLIKDIQLGGTDCEEIKGIKYHDPATFAKMWMQLRGLMKESNNVRVGTLNNVVVKGDDLYANAARQLKAIDAEVSDADA